MEPSKLQYINTLIGRMFKPYKKYMAKTLEQIHEKNYAESGQYSFAYKGQPYIKLNHNQTQRGVKLRPIHKNAEPLIIGFLEMSETIKKEKVFVRKLLIKHLHLCKSSAQIYIATPECLRKFAPISFTSAGLVDDEGVPVISNPSERDIFYNDLLDIVGKVEMISLL